MDINKKISLLNQEDAKKLSEKTLDNLDLIHWCRKHKISYVTPDIFVAQKKTYEEMFGKEKREPIEIGNSEDLFDKKVRCGEEVYGFMKGVYVGERKTANKYSLIMKPSVITRDDGVIRIQQRDYSNKQAFTYYFISEKHRYYEEFNELLKGVER